MKSKLQPIDSVAEACTWFLEQRRQHPERDLAAAQEAAWLGQRRPHAVLYMAHLAVPDDKINPPGELELPEVRMAASSECDLATEIVRMAEPLGMLNPIAPIFGLGLGPGTLVTSFGIPLNAEANNTAAYNRPLLEVLAEPPPDPVTSGMIPDMHRRIETVLASTPPDFKFYMPDLQGPYNLIHAIIGTDAFIAPYEDPDHFHALMDRATTLWIAVQQNLRKWIGPDRLAIGEGSRIPRISECSVNLVSPDFYREFILPHDQRIAQAFPQLHIHPCSGPHVFHATFNALPVRIAEAGYIARTAAGAISVDEALQTIGDKPILLFVGQELPEGEEYEFICRDLDRLRANPRILLGYTGMHWRRKDRPRMREIHRRLDNYWQRISAT